MNKIEVGILNVEVIEDGEKMMVAMARMTQHGEKISCLSDLRALIEKPYTAELVNDLCGLPHPNIQKFARINIGIVGASRRFLTQITRHQDDVKFMSGSLQYSDYSGKAKFCVPYEVTVADSHAAQEAASWSGAETGSLVRNYTPNAWTNYYLDACEEDLKEYEELVPIVGRDAAGYKMPQGMRNVLVISTTPWQWRHIISQRACNRNTLETQYVMLRCWEELIGLSDMFKTCGPECMNPCGCLEGHMACGKILNSKTVGTYRYARNCSLPTAILDTKFKEIR